jgi:hypothetical protein
MSGLAGYVYDVGDPLVSRNSVLTISAPFYVLNTRQYRNL